MNLNEFGKLEPAKGGIIPVGSFDKVVTADETGQEFVEFVWNPILYKVRKAVKECCEIAEDQKEE